MANDQPALELEPSEQQPVAAGTGADPSHHPSEPGVTLGGTPDHALGIQADAALRVMHAMQEGGSATAGGSGLQGFVGEQILPLLALLRVEMEPKEAPLRPADRALASTYARLLNELAALQMRIVNDGMTHGALSPADAGARLRLVLFLKEALARHLWRLYQAEPTGFWRETYRALQLAEGMAVASAPAAPSECDAFPGVASVETLFARIAVLASSDVYSLRRGEIRGLAQWLQQRPLKCNDGMRLPDDEGRARIRLTLNEDRPPSLIMGESPRDANTRYVDLGPVLDALDSDPEGLLVPEARRTGASSLLQRLRRRWIVPPARQFKREPADFGPLITATGLRAVRAMMRADLAYQRTVTELDLDLLPGGLFAPESSDPAQLPAILVFGGTATLDPQGAARHNGDGPPTGTEVHHLSGRELERIMRAWESALGAVDTPTADAEPADADGQLQTRPTVSWLKNVGAGGCCLHLQSPSDTIICGNLIALRITEQERTLWPLGIIRWLRYEGTDGVTVGVQYLSQNSALTEISVDDADTGLRTTQPGLFFHEYGRGGAAILLESPGTLAPGASIRFSIGSQQHAATLTAIRPEGHALWRADFVPIDGPSDRADPARIHGRN